MPEPAQNISELHALVTLLDEPDDTAFSRVQEKLFSFGSAALPVLEQAKEDIFDKKVQERIRHIIRTIRFNETVSGFREWVKAGTADLLQGIYLLSKADDHSVSEDEICREIEKIRLDAWLELNEDLTALESVKVLNHILFRVHQFEGEKQPGQEGHYSLPDLLLTRKGNSLTMGVLYLILAQKLKLPIMGVDLPRHFILAYLSEPDKSIPGVDDIQFYINPMNKGSVFTRREIELFIKQLNVPADISYFSPCPNVRVAARMIEALIGIAESNHLPEKRSDLEHLRRLIDHS